MLTSGRLHPRLHESGENKRTELVKKVSEKRNDLTQLQKEQMVGLHREENEHPVPEQMGVHMKKVK